LEGYTFGVPFFIEVGIYDFDAGTTERKLQMHDAHSTFDIVGDDIL
jgi:hypothetical protein